MLEMVWQKGFPVICTDNTLDGGGSEARCFLDKPWAGTKQWFVTLRDSPQTTTHYPMEDIRPDEEALDAGEWPGAAPVVQ